MLLTSRGRQVFAHINDPVAKDWSFVLACFTGPIMIVACASHLILTNAALPANKFGWANKVIAYVVRFRPASAEEGYHIAKKNQFLKGEPNFNVIALFVIGLPFVLQLTYFKTSMPSYDAEAVEYGWDDKRLQREKTLEVSYMSGWIGIFALMWFLIPVARHSVLLVAMGWSPVHALRIHIWAGHLSFLFVAIHAITMLIVWFQDPIPVYQQFIPPAECWSWNAQNNPNNHDEEDHAEIHYGCDWQFFNLTGMIAMIVFTALWVSSLHWFRRRNYRLFYLLHVILGTLMLLSSLLHYAFMIMYWLPSITYYLASTSPTLIQALASRYRGGVKIKKVVSLSNAAGCFEVHVDTSKESAVALNKMPSQFVKLCVPKISVVWHPFTVFAHPKDPTTLRILCRPVGPFTKQLVEQLTAPTRPVTILDGFYAGANRCQEALLHDHVTIVAGGVAITPFLSMIPALIREIASRSVDAAYTKGISLHWACREEGLMIYIVQNYMKAFQEEACAAGIKFDVTIYHTGEKTFVTKETSEMSDDPEQTDEGSAFGSVLKSDSMICVDKQSTSSDSNGKNDSAKNEDSESCNNCCYDSENEDCTVYDADDLGVFSDKEGAAAKSPDTAVDKGDTAATFESGGFAMELGRMMPARFSKFYWNIPVFVAFGLPIWLGYVLIHQTYILDRAVNFREMTTTAFFTVVMVLMFGMFGVIVEGMVLHLRTRWPSERLDDFTLETVATSNVNQIVDLESNNKAAGKTNDQDLVSLVVLTGRPSGPQVLDGGAREAEAPGIFLCGPEKLIEMVKCETSKENKAWLGRTRYCLYFEPFEF
jgi:predicted ferric reductase